MAQHRQAPRQFKEEPGHDSVSDILFPNSCDTPPIADNPVVTSRHQCGSAVASLPRPDFDRTRTQLAGDKSISQDVVAFATRG